MAKQRRAAKKHANFWISSSVGLLITEVELEPHALVPAVFVLHADLHSILLFFLYVLKSISEIGAYSTFLQLGDNHEHGPEVQDASFLIWLLASAKKRRAAM